MATTETRTLVFSPSPFSVALQHVRRLRGLSQIALADRVGCDNSTIARIELGERAPSRDMAARIAQSLDLGERESADLLLTAGYAAACWSIRAANRLLAGGDLEKEAADGR